DRDRFVLSAGHGSALLYSLLHLTGFKVTVNDLKNFRQLGGITPGHPEFGMTDGVEATTGPLGQGIANAVGMAMAEKHLAALYNKEGLKIVDHYTYALCGDGDLMEGVASEASSLAGHLGLGKLIVLYDSNDICLDGPLSTSFSDNIEERYKSYGWHYIKVTEGTNAEDISRAIELAKTVDDKPTMIEIKTVIGYGSEVQGTNKAHGAPLGKEGSAKAKENLGWTYAPFEVPESVYESFKKSNEEVGKSKYNAWKTTFEEYSAKYPEDAKSFLEAFEGKVTINREALPSYKVGDKDAATRVMSQAAIQSIGKELNNFWGGSADLSSSNNTIIKEAGDFTAANGSGKNIWYGVREFAMGAIMNGILYHGGTKTFAATFFVFSDYVRPAVRLAALSHLPAIYVFTHDSVAVGEDGPTHEPVEHLASFRAMPNVNVIRPADGNETSAAWKMALETTDKPTLLVLSRQNLPQVTDNEKAFEGMAKGAYILSKSAKETPDGILIATGSEVSLALKAQEMLKKDGVDVSVVSMPCMEIFKKQSVDYKDSVLPWHVKNRLSIEMGVSQPWDRYIGDEGIAVSIETFGASGKGGEVVKSYGFTAENIVAVYKENFK
ncbi:MAG: transketolase, partial [Clostridiaceae bacterium]